MVEIVRMDKYNIKIDGVRVPCREGDGTEERLRQMTSQQLENFKKIMGG